MKQIPLTNGKVAVVDDEDFERLSKYSWCINAGKYAARGYHLNKKVVIEKMHHAVIGKPPEGYVVDHINGDTLDNRKCNLRFITQQQNCFNSRKKAIHHNEEHRSVYKGVWWRRARSKWVSYICVNGHKVYLGLYSNEQEAALAYNEAAKKYHGEYARLNDI